MSAHIDSKEKELAELRTQLAEAKQLNEKLHGEGLDTRRTETSTEYTQIHAQSC